MADVCTCCSCPEKLKTRIGTYIQVLNALNGLTMTSARKLDLLYVLSNEINADNNLLVQISNMKTNMTKKIEDIDAGTLPGSFKFCVEESLKDVKVNTPAEYDALLAVLNTYWEGKFILPPVAEETPAPEGN